jgi:hypothetical protein
MLVPGPCRPSSEQTQNHKSIHPLSVGVMRHTLIDGQLLLRTSQVARTNQTQKCQDLDQVCIIAR